MERGREAKAGEIGRRTLPIPTLVAGLDVLTGLG